MKRLTIVVLSVVVVVVLASCASNQGSQSGMGEQDIQRVTSSSPTTFVEEANVPEGKALLYIYWPGQMALQFDETGDPLVLAKSGPIGILPQGGYYRYVTESGTIKLWLVSLYAKGLKFELLLARHIMSGSVFPAIFPVLWVVLMVDFSLQI
jgi:hypothetical protein